ncbi:MAG: DUF92 domain-containing protein [Thermoplasmata archaeon]|nr:DUF92 domain-containing protein [Thermoplasmata archaeon]
MLSLLPAVVAILATVALALGATLARALTPAAGVVAAVFGAIIVVFAGYAFLALLILFVVASVLATRYRFTEKQQRNVQEGRVGERGIANVVAHILIPTGLALAAGGSPPLLSLPTVAVLYASALAFGAADTFGSEFGVLAGRARSILTARLVTPGTNGGVSGTGELWAAIGAVTTGLIGFVLYLLFGTSTPPGAVLVGVVAVSGFVGCQVDSVLGETLENRGLLTKHSTNFFGMLSSVVLSAALLGALGWWR